MPAVNLRGFVAATVTPMHSDFSLDEQALRGYLRGIADQGVDGIAVNVDTGEGPHLYPEERLRVVQIAAEEVGDRVTVVAGLSATFTDQAVRLARDTAAAGARALLVFPIPAYLGSPQRPELPEGHHAAIGRACGLPLIAFQLQPALGGTVFTEEALRRVLRVDEVVAVKEASFDAYVFTRTARIVRDVAREPGQDVALLNGDDNFLLEAYLLGAEGALLGFGTLATREQVAMLAAVRAGKLDEAKALGVRLQELCDRIFAPPVGEYRARTKYALTLLGAIPADHVRPPLLPLDQPERDRVRRALIEGGLL